VCFGLGRNRQDDFSSWYLILLPHLLLLPRLCKNVTTAEGWSDVGDGAGCDARAPHVLREVVGTTCPATHHLWCTYSVFETSSCTQSNERILCADLASDQIAHSEGAKECEPLPRVCVEHDRVTRGSDTKAQERIPLPRPVLPRSGRWGSLVPEGIPDGESSVPWTDEAPPARDGSHQHLDDPGAHEPLNEPVLAHTTSLCV